MLMCLRILKRIAAGYNSDRVRISFLHWVLDVIVVSLMMRHIHYCFVYNFVLEERNCCKKLQKLIQILKLLMITLNWK